MGPGSEQELRTFVEERGQHLLGFAWLLCGDWARAEDLVQTAMERAWRRWEAIRSPEARYAYVRRCVLSANASWIRRLASRETPIEVDPDWTDDSDFTSGLVLRNVLGHALDKLPPRQRAAIVLRYFEDLTEADTAIAMRCSIGTVKSHTARALATLRQLAELDVLREGNHDARF